MLPPHKENARACLDLFVVAYFDFARVELLSVGAWDLGCVMLDIVCA